MFRRRFSLQVVVDASNSFIFRRGIEAGVWSALSTFIRNPFATRYLFTDCIFVVSLWLLKRRTLQQHRCDTLRGLSPSFLIFDLLSNDPTIYHALFPCHRVFISLSTRLGSQLLRIRRFIWWAEDDCGEAVWTPSLHFVNSHINLASLQRSKNSLSEGFDQVVASSVKKLRYAYFMVAAYVILIFFRFRLKNQCRSLSAMVVAPFFDGPPSPCLPLGKSCDDLTILSATTALPSCTSVCLVYYKETYKVLFCNSFSPSINGLSIV